jgi:predicted aldo/keto reductase-like oxidoreductase
MTHATAQQPLAMGGMRLSTDPERDDERAIATLHAALDAGVTLLDTADEAFARALGFTYRLAGEVFGPA